MSTAVFGGAGAGSTLTSTANAFGLVGGTGADSVENVGRIDVDANAHVTANKTSVSFVAGSPAVSALLTSNATVVGIDGVGDDADQLTNAGILFAKGSSVSSITGGAKTNVSGGGESTGTGSAQSTAYGIRGALALAGRNTITNSGLLDVTANSDSTVVNDSKAGLLLAIGTKPTANSSAVVDASGHGVWSANGDNDVVNTDRLVVNAVSNGYGFTSSTGAHLAIKGDAISESTATATVTASGVTLGTGTNHIVNDGSMNVAGSATTVKSLTTTVNVCEPNPAPDSDPDTPDETICHDESRELSFKPTYASANGNGASGTGRATATGTATVTSYALNAGDGANSFSNNDTITVTASPEARTVAFADNDAAGIADGTAVASATANAFGVLVGHGSNTLTNAGTMTISALPTAQADVSVTGGVEVSACIDYFFGTWCFTVDPGVERGTARATLGASAVGMSAGNGANTIVNSGVMTVEARPVIDVFAARTLHADSGESTVSTTSHSTATGILTGDGNNAILNDAGGIIDVRADGGSVCNGTCTRTSNAYGIQTGSGDDVIVNRGEIKASAVNGSGTALAIDSGDGNDRVVLDEGSRTMAAVRLGAGDDRLVWGSSATLSATADGGSGTADVFALGGKTGSTFELSDIGTTFTGFERFHKEGASTWTLAGNRTIDWTVEQGRLQVQDQLTGTVATAAAGALNPEIGVLAGATLRRTDTAAVAVVNSDGLLANSGLVDSGAAGGVGVVTDGIGATVFNAGTLNATGTAVRMQGLDGLVVNSGLVQAAGSAIVMSGSGNTMQNDAAGVIQSGSGAAIVGGAGSDGVVNSGRVTGGAGTSLDLGGGSDQLVVSDVSRFDGVARGGDGIDTLVIDPSIHTFNLSSIGSLYDSFEIQKKQGASSLTLAGTGTGDWLLDAGTISLAGTLTGTLSTLAGGLNPILRIDPAGRLSAPGGAAAVILNGGALLENAGVIDGGVSGVVMTGAGNMLLNDGRINGSVDALGIAGRIENRGSIQSGDVGVRLFGEGSSIVNDGLIAAQSDGIQIGAGGAFLVNNGSIFSATGAAIRGSSGNDALFNNGLISAARGIAVDFAGGNDLLVMNGRSAFGGQVLGGAGSDVVQVASDSGNGVMNLSQFEGFELLQKLGNSTWQINGASDMAWDLAGGRLVVDGTLGGPGRVQANSILGGHGIVGSVSNSGVVAPGNSIGTLRVAGDYDHAATATLEVETDAAGASDRLIVNGVSVLRGGTLDIRPEAGRYGIATEYAFLASGGGVAGSFDTVTSSMATLDPLLEYSGQGATVVLVRNDVSFKAMADTANMADLGSVLDASKRSMARGDFRFAMNQFLDIDNAAQTDALATLTGELHGASVRSLLRTGDRFFASAVDRRPSAQVEGDRRLMWTDAVGYSGSVAGDGNASRASYRTTGLVGGIELLAGETGRVGASFGFAPGTTTLNRLGADKASSRSWMPAVYGEYDPGAWSVAVGAGYARHSVQTERRVNIGLVDRRAVASYDANQYSGMVRAGLRLPGTAMMSLKAFGEARYSSLAGGEFNESGADSLNLVDASRSDSSTLRTLAGIRAIWSPKFWNSALKPEVSAAWSHEAMDVRSGLSARIAGTTMFGSAPSFTSFGASEARNGAVVRVGASTGMTKHGNAYVTYDGNLSDRGSDNGFSAGVKMSW
ncbi:MAG TPA: autotransporter outer membrane beta-barrel domain-containing protein [Vicinamibacterales bacterium]|nr:autotransporter outer membrane beta-barrel domain-containing protein [Vicinamibacterales bacterium]